MIMTKISKRLHITRFGVVKHNPKKGKTEWVKVKDNKVTKIEKPKNIEKLLNQGYSVSRAITVNRRTKIRTWSPLTKRESLQKMGKIN